MPDTKPPTTHLSGVQTRRRQMQQATGGHLTHRAIICTRSRAVHEELRAPLMKIREMVLTGRADTDSREFKKLARQVMTLRDKHHPEVRNRTKVPAAKKANNPFFPRTSTGETAAATPPAMASAAVAAPDTDAMDVSDDMGQPASAAPGATLEERIAVRDALLAQALETNAKLAASLAASEASNAALVKENAEKTAILRSIWEQYEKLQNEYKDARHMWANDWFTSGWLQRPAPAE
ncbi:hypothetical protein O9K51_09632 [Purpureocillium lavendulum]|uniref:Uncharacterized protein n=1 Tax=Purpureocillium lavendulum TaxID=1247861 RepID=A0AB34FFJ5_9HYPO|nr:hypothetical protein O9K51_09632 [Purpureocillium lavendulum]